MPIHMIDFPVFVELHRISCYSKVAIVKFVII